MHDFKCAGQYSRFVLADSKPKYEEDMTFRTKHIKLILDIDMKAKAIKGECITKLVVFESNKRIMFNAVGFRVISVKVDGKKSDFEYNEKHIEIPLTSEKRELEVSISYSLSNPKRGAYFKDDQVWTHSESQDARYWYPCLDIPENKSSFELMITVDKDYFAVSNGDLVKIEHGARKTFHWNFNYPNASYLNMFAVGRFVEVRDKWNDVDVLYYCEKGREEEIKRSFGLTPKMLDFFSKKIGVKYPFKKYAQVAISKFSYGGMEHTTATSMTDNALQDEISNSETPYYPIMLASHELAHQWFGDLLTCKTWNHAWLNEGFASYFEILFSESLKGKDDALYEKYKDDQAYFEEDKTRYRRPIVTNLFMYPEDIFDRHLYQKGSAVLHMIRSILTDDVWWKVIHHYVKNNAGKNVETKDLVDSIRDVTGINMGRFFDQWVYSAGHPELKIMYFWDNEKKEASVRVAQIQGEESPIFAFPVEFDFDGERFKETIENKQHLFKFKMKSEPKLFRFDPEQIILKKVDTLKPRKMWLEQIQKDDNVLGRIQSAQEIAKFGDVDAIKNAFMKEKFWGVRSEFASSLGTIQTEYSYNTLVKILKIEKDNRVKRSILESIGNFRKKETVKMAKKLIKTKNSYIIPAESFRAIGRTRDSSVLSILKTGLKMKSWNDIVRSVTIDGIASLQTEESFRILKDALDKKHSQNSRLSAVRNLVLIGRGRDDVFELLMQLTEDELELVQISAVVGLGDLGDERALPKLRDLSKGDFDHRVKRLALESIKKIQPWNENPKDEETSNK